jgi:hypothetical protein
MNKQFNNLIRYILLLTFLTYTGCMVNYPLTTFYVKNNTNKTVNFKASVIKLSTMGQFEMTLPFSIPPYDSTIARRVGFRKDASPADWFTSFVIFPIDSIAFNDPKKEANWIKTIDPKGKPIYTFTIAK